MDFLNCFVCKYNQTFLVSIRCCEAMLLPLDYFEHIMIMVSFLRMLSKET